MKTKIVTALTGFALLFLGCQPKPTSIDLIVYNAEMVTVDEAIPYAQAMAIDQGQNYSDRVDQSAFAKI